MSANEPTASPIAIIGMGLRLPGGVSTPVGFWDLLTNKKDAKCRVPADRYNIGAFHNDKTKKQNVASEYGYFLDVNLKAFDASFFSSKPKEVEVTDPQQRLLLEVVWECLESAGQTGLRGTNTGVYVGVFGEDWHNMLHKDDQAFSAYRVLSAGDYALANRLSYEFDFRGPSMTIRTACSASLSGLHLACQSIQSGACDAAVVAGSSIIMDPSMTMDMSQQGVLSPTGSCKTFDAAADGFARGEAVNALLIKPLDKALTDGDPVRAIIKSTAVNSDGKMSHMGSPSAESQEALIRSAYQAAGIEDSSQTGYFECHGTGTAVGDPLEVEAVGRVFGDRGTYIGSVKPNVGHGEGASAITSIMKAVLCLEHKTIPPNVNFTVPNPKIPFQKYKLAVPLESTPWPKDRHLRASVNSFGIGGANAHVVLDSPALLQEVSQVLMEPNGISKRLTNRVCDKAASPTRIDTTSDSTNGSGNNSSGARSSYSWWPQLFPVSANSSKSLHTRVDDLREYIKSSPGCLDNLAYTLSRRRIHLPYRSFCIVEDGPVESLEFAPVEKIAGGSSEGRGVTYIFTGQGAQWAGMARGLIHSSPSFHEDICDMDKVLQKLDQPPQWTLKGLLISDSEDSEAINRADISQPLCTAIQIALVNFFTNCGIAPSAVVGHSSGEIAAAYAAGGIKMKEAILCAYLRGQVAKNVPHEGSMAAIGMGRQEVQPYLAEGAEVACENSPESVTISGNSDSIEKTLDTIKSREPDIFTRLLHVNVAYHSKADNIIYHMRDVGDLYESSMRLHLCEVKGKLHVPFYSTVSARLAPPDMEFGPEYWRSNMESPVLFKGAVHTMLADMPQTQAIMEIGPHSALQAPLGQIIRSNFSQTPPAYIPTLIRNTDCVNSVLEAVGKLYSRGTDVDFSFINPEASLLVDLPNYPWDHDQEFWKENRVSEAWRFRKYPHHELLGSRCPVSSDIEHIWRNLFHESDAPWLRDHKVGTDVVFPCAAYIAMMGEAVRQSLGVNSYCLQNLTVKSALVLPEMDTIEIMTTMRPSQVTERTNSTDWHDMTISTFNGSHWVENCVAQGKAGDETEGNRRPTTTIVPHKRHISPRYFYDRMNYLGMRYGPHFQGLKDIIADTDQYVAAASMRNDEPEKGARYPLHPAIIDCCLQLHAVAGCKGIARNVDSLALPIDIRHITICPGGPDLLAEARLDPINMSGSAVAIDTSGRLVVSLDKTKGIPFETGDSPSRKETLDLARLEWLPHIDYMSPDGLIKRGNSQRESRILLEKISIFGVLQTLDVIKSLGQTPSGHLAKYVSWMEKEKEKMAQGNRQVLASESHEWSSLSHTAREPILESLLRQADAGGGRVSNIARMLSDIAQPHNVLPLFTGEKNPLEPMLDENRLEDLYRFQAESVNPTDFFHLCGHANPTLRILEIGAGTGSTTEQVLSALVSNDGIRMYSQYMFTDISPGFLTRAKDKFNDYKCMEYRALDIEKDPAEQGFELGSFDLVIASNVLHTTSSLKQSLRNVHSLLRRGGRLYLDELAKPSDVLGVPFIMGRLPGWWTGGNDGRSDFPSASLERWRKELESAGFSGVDSALDDEGPYRMFTHITSTAVTSKPKPEAVVFLYKETRVEFGKELAACLERSGISVHWRKIDDGRHDEINHVISTVDLEYPFFADISEEDYGNFMGYLSSLRGGILWLSRPAQVCCTNPDYGVLNGIARTIRIELSVDFWTAELEDLASSSAEAVLAISQNFFSREPLRHGVDSEFFVRQGTTYVGRYHWESLSKALEPKTSQNHDTKQLVIGNYGLIESLHWVQQESKPLQPHEVELNVHCVGLNFKDIMVTMGLVPRPKDYLGFEATGVVSHVGSGVDHVQVGDRVFVISNGLLATRKIVPSHCVVKIPENLTFEQAVTMPIVYATVIYAVITLGQLQKGQSILIHSGTGGVGQAAIQVCQSLGAEIYATVGTEEKTEYLSENHGIQRERIFDSHSTSFLDDVMQATNGRGVDVVLNSLSGELLHASWKCVAACGKMLEIGKRDILEHGRLALDMFQDNRTFYGIDMETLFRDRPGTLQSLAYRLRKLSANDQVKPIQPIHTFPAQKISEAIRFMKKGEHIGKIVITMPESPKDIPVTRMDKNTMLSDTSTYLVVGGLGGLGTSAKDQAFLEEIKSQGCRAVVASGSVSEMTDVQRAIELSPSKIAGVLQMSMVIRDRPALDMTHDDYRAVQTCKTKGTWNLHNALSGTTGLEFFILMSSISGSVGHPGQLNYTSANTFLDSFAQYRQSLGLPCSVIDLGGMEGIGFLSERPKKLNQYRSFGLRTLDEQHLIDAIQLAMKPGESTISGPPTVSLRPFGNSNQFVVGLNTTKSLSDPTNRALYKGDPRVSLYHNVAPAEQNSSSGRDDIIRDLLARAEADPHVLLEPDVVEKVSWDIGRTLFGFLLLPEEELDINLTLSYIGIDSLVSIEIRNWWRKMLGLDITVLEIMNAGTIIGLGRLAIGSLKVKYGVKEDGDEEGHGGNDGASPHHE